MCLYVDVGLYERDKTMTRNEGTLDRDIRIVLSVLFLLIALFTPVGFWQLIPLTVAGIMFLTAAMGFCPLYSVFGISTCKRQ